MKEYLAYGVSLLKIACLQMYMCYRDNLFSSVKNNMFNHVKGNEKDAFSCIHYNHLLKKRIFMLPEIFCLDI